MSDIREICACCLNEFSPLSSARGDASSLCLWCLTTKQISRIKTPDSLTPLKYVKCAPIAAMQYRIGINDAAVKRFIERNGGHHTNIQKGLRVYKTNFESQLLWDGDYVAVENFGIVFPIAKLSFEKEYMERK